MDGERGGVCGVRVWLAASSGMMFDSKTYDTYELESEGVLLRLRSTSGDTNLRLEPISRCKNVTRLG